MWFQRSSWIRNEEIIIFPKDYEVYLNIGSVNAMSERTLDLHPQLMNWLHFLSFLISVAPSHLTIIH